MRFLFFNLAVIAALVYLFSADRSGPDIVADHREDALEAIHQELDSLARDVVDGLLYSQGAPACPRRIRNWTDLE